MKTIGLVFSLGMLAVLAYIAWTLYSQYRKTTTGSTLERLIAAARNSETILWNQFCIGLAAIVANLDHICDLLNMPETKQFIDTWVGNPKVVALVMVLISTITIGARLRKSSLEPLT